MTHPDSIRGLTPKLNWMLDRLPDDEGLIFLDDDLEYLGRCFVERNDLLERKVTDVDLIFEILRGTAALAADASVYFFGWESSESTIRYYSGHDPFKFSGFINGCAMGFLNGHGLRFDETIVAKNDYDLCARKKDDTQHAPERLFLVHAVIALCRSYKSRVVDHALIVFYEGKRGARSIPDFALDRHTQRGRRMKRGWSHFFTEGIGDQMIPDAYSARAQQIRRDDRLELADE